MFIVIFSLYVCMFSVFIQPNNFFFSLNARHSFSTQSAVNTRISI